MAQYQRAFRFVTQHVKLERENLIDELQLYQHLVHYGLSSRLGDILHCENNHIGDVVTIFWRHLNVIIESAKMGSGRD